MPAARITSAIVHGSGSPPSAWRAQGSQIESLQLGSGMRPWHPEGPSPEPTSTLEPTKANVSASYHEVPPTPGAAERERPTSPHPAATRAFSTGRPAVMSMQATGTFGFSGSEH
jgi:hypothetical protein